MAQIFPWLCLAQVVRSASSDLPLHSRGHNEALPWAHSSASRMHWALHSLRRARLTSSLERTLVSAACLLCGLPDSLRAQIMSWTPLYLQCLGH